MTLRTRRAGPWAAPALPLVVLGLALGLPGPRASAHPLVRLHVRPSLYRVAPPRGPLGRLPALARQAAGLVPQASSLAATASLARAVIAQAPAHAPWGRH